MGSNSDATTKFRCIPIVVTFLLSFVTAVLVGCPVRPSTPSPTAAAPTTPATGATTPPPTASTLATTKPSKPTPTPATEEPTTPPVVTVEPTTPAPTPTPTLIPPTSTPTPPVFGITITDPPDKSSVVWLIAVRGTATGPLPKGQYLWIVVEYGQDCWPQVTEITPVFSAASQKYEWFVPAPVQVGKEADRGLTFGITALLVPQGIHDDFSRWFEENKRAGPREEWKPFVVRDLLRRGAQMLARNMVTRQASTPPPVQYELSIDIKPPGAGTVSPFPGKFDAGRSVQLTASPSANYDFDFWGGDASGTGTSTTVTMKANRRAVANFKIRRYSLTVSVNPPDSGTVSPPRGLFDAGSTVSLTATPFGNYIFDRWSGDATGSQNPLPVTMDRNKSIMANFIPPAATLAPTPTPTYYTLSTDTMPFNVGSVTGGGSYPGGVIVSIQAIPSVGWVFNNWSGDATGSQNPLPVTMDRNKSITANFIPPAPTPMPTPTPIINVSPTSVDFGSVETSKIISIANKGGGTLNWSTSTSQPWLSVSPGNGTGNAVIMANVSRTSLVTGNYSGSVTITSNGGNVTVQVALQVLAPTIAIIQPTPGSQVDWRFTVSGTTTGVFGSPNYKLYILIKPLGEPAGTLNGPWYVQPPVLNFRPDGTWDVLAYCGRDPAQFPGDAGDYFEVQALVTTTTLQEGQLFPVTAPPASVAKSQSVHVRRTFPVPILDLGYASTGPNYEEIGYNYNDGAVHRHAQSFQFEFAPTITDIKLPLQYGYGPARDIVVKIETDNAGIPSGTSVLPGGEAYIIGFTDKSFSWHSVSLATPVSLSANTKYWITVKVGNETVGPGGTLYSWAASGRRYDDNSEAGWKDQTGVWRTVAAIDLGLQIIGH